MEEQLVLFSLNNEEYGVSIAQVKEIIQYNGATKFPNTKSYMEGVINLRDKIVPIVNLALMLGLSVSDDAHKRALIVETGGKDVGIVVDKVTEVVRIPQSSIDPPPTTIKKEYIWGIGKEGERLLILLDMDKLFSNEEQLKVVST